MGRNILAVIVGVIVAGVVTFVVQMLGHMVYPPPEGMDPMDIESIRTYMTQLSTGAFVMVLVAYLVGTFVGAFTAAKIAHRRRMLVAMIVGVIELIFGIINFVMLPHPMWFMAASVIVFLGAAWLAGKVAGADLAIGPDLSAQ